MWEAGVGFGGEEEIGSIYPYSNFHGVISTSNLGL
jgi:hypothetical protein